MQERAERMRRKMTPAETKLWKRLRAGRLNGFHFRRQQIVGGYIVDFYCHKTNLVVEVDGGIHQDRVEYDCERDKVLRSRGLTVLRVTNRDVNHKLDQVLDTILSVCESHSSRE